MKSISSSDTRDEQNVSRTCFRWSLLRGCFHIAILLCFAAGGLSAQAASESYRVLAQWSLEGTSGSRSMVNDAPSHLLYVVRNDRVTVIDTTTGLVAGEILGLTDARTVALDPNGKLGYISDGVSGNLHVFDRMSRKLLTTIVVDGIPDELILEPGTQRLFVFNAHSPSVSVIDPKAGRIIATVTLSGRPASAVADGHGSIFVNLNTTSQVSKLDAESLKVITTWPLAPCNGPSGIAIDDSGTQLFSVCENRLLVTSDVRTRKVVSMAAIGEGARAVAFDPANQLLFASNADGTLTVLQRAAPAKVSAVQTVKTRPGSRLLAFDSVNRRVYLVAAQFGQRPGPTSEELQYRPTISPGSASVLVVGR